MSNIKEATKRMIIGIIIGIIILLLGVTQIYIATSEAGTGTIAYTDLGCLTLLIGFLIIIGSLFMAYRRVHQS